MRGCGETGLRHRFGDIQRWLIRDVPQNASLCARSEQSSLWTLQDLDTFQIGGVDVEIAAWKLRGLFIEVDRDVGEATVDSRRLIWKFPRPQTTHVDAVLSGTYPVRGNARQVFVEVIKSRDVELGKRGVRQHLNRHRYLLQGFRATVGSDNDFIRTIFGIVLPYGAQ